MIVVTVPIRDKTDVYENPYLKWCEDHCQGEWYIKKFIPEMIEGWFMLEQDATIFSLRWS